MGIHLSMLYIVFQGYEFMYFTKNQYWSYLYVLKYKTAAKILVNISWGTHFKNNFNLFCPTPLPKSLLALAGYLLYVKCLLEISLVGIHR